MEFHAGRGHRVRSIVGGIALALLIGGGFYLWPCSMAETPSRNGTSPAPLELTCCVVKVLGPFA